MTCEAGPARLNPAEKNGRQCSIWLAVRRVRSGGQIGACGARFAFLDRRVAERGGYVTKGAV